MILKDIGKYCARKFDLFCFNCASLASGIPDLREQIAQTIDGGALTGYGFIAENASSRVHRIDQADKSRGSNTEWVDSEGSNRSYYIGSYEFYRFLIEALRKKGMEYHGNYYRSPGDSYNRTKTLEC